MGINLGVYVCYNVRYKNRHGSSKKNVGVNYCKFLTYLKTEYYGLYHQ